MKLTTKNKLGNTGLEVPPIIYGTSYLGNLYQDLSYEYKKELIQGWFDCTERPVVIDSAGKYGAGLALEMIGEILADLNISPSDIVISNKLGWYRVPLETEEPTFEPGVWKGLKYDAVQKISYDGIIQCWKQGNELLGGKYKADVVSVHDPDEYLAAAVNKEDRISRFADILEAYKALFELKKKGEIKAVGVGSKDWTIIRELYDQVKFDWVMIANSFTIMKHTPDFMKFINQLYKDGVGVINSAVFQAGFLTGGEFFDYRKVEPDSEEGKFIYQWRDQFNKICSLYSINPSEACIRFAMSHPAVAAIALNTSKVKTMHRNVDTMMAKIPNEFWVEMKKAGLISSDYSFI
ncbi:MAG: aldo/keto reductase [Marinilabiliaceae bacterium]|nr:aldo/keto reductase [Marinilabiliaceae bacterium]